MLDLIRKQIRIGASLSVVLKTGEEFVGVLREIGDSYIIIGSADADVTLSGEMIGGWKMQNEAARAVHRAPDEEGDANAAARLSEIERKINGHVKGVTLKPLPLHTAWPKDDYLYVLSSQRQEAVREWNKVCNQHEYALKIRDQVRLRQALSKYEEMFREYPRLSIVHYNIGCIRLALGEVVEAAAAFEAAAAKLKDPFAYYNLAVAALRHGDAAKAHHSLLAFFKQASPATHRSAWYVFLALAVRFEGLNEIVDLFTDAMLEKRHEDASTIVEGVVFILKVNHNLSPSHEVVRLLDKTAFDEDDAHLVRALLISRGRERPAPVADRARPAPTALAVEGVWRRRQTDAGAESGALDDTGPIHITDAQTGGNGPDTGPFLLNNSDTGPAMRGPYAQAKRALKVKTKTAKAEELKTSKVEELLRRAIEQNDNLKAAFKDLVLLLQRTQRGVDAIHLLRQYEAKLADKLTYNNLLASTYQSVGNHREAIIHLNKVLEGTAPRKQYPVRISIAWSYIQLGELTHARNTLERALENNPQDYTAYELLKLLDENKLADTPRDLTEKIQKAVDPYAFDLMDIHWSLSKFLKFYLDDCKFIGLGVPDAAQEHTFEDVKKLNGLIDAADKDKDKRLRSQYNLTAARLLIDLKSPDEQQVRFYLQEYAADMGDISLSERKPKEVIFAYYQEAFSIATKLRQNTKQNTKMRDRLSQVMMLFYSSGDELVMERSLETRAALEAAFKYPEVGRALLMWLLEITRLNSQVIGKFLLVRIFSSAQLLLKVKELCDELVGTTSEPITQESQLARLWERAGRRVGSRNEDIVREFVWLQWQSMRLDSLGEQVERVRLLMGKFNPGSLDLERLRQINKILGSIYEYSKQHLYIERERLATIIENDINDFVNRIVEAPTKFSLELFHPYASALKETVEQHFNKVKMAAEPDQLEMMLSIDSYIPDHNSDIDCQITISNQEGKSPASEVRVELEPSPSGEYTPLRNVIQVAEALHGGQHVTCQLPVRVTEEAVRSQVFTLHYKLSYHTRGGQQIQKSDQMPISLDSAGNFTGIPNPYAAWAEAGEVTVDDMFYGRDQLIKNLLSAIDSAPEAKSLVIYGQKRAGKSSVLYHLHKRLQLPIISIKFSLGEVFDLTVATFLARMMQCIESKFEDFAEEGLPPVRVERPSLSALNESPDLEFHDYMRRLRAAMRRHSAYDGARLMLLIDEFTYLYGEIKRGRIPDTFMKFWKALLQRRYFGSVLVGQDIMRQFIESFPNEFQVAQSERVSYLQYDEARKLIVRPTQMAENEESRFKGAAVDRMIELTAASPFYIQIFCNRLIEYMVRRKLMRVTDAHIEQVKDELIRGNNSLTKDKFDNLVSAGDDTTDVAPSEEVRAVLHDIAAATRLQDYCDESELSAAGSVPLKVILDDLVTREVLERRVTAPEGSGGHRTALYKIRVGLFKEWLLCQ